MLLSEVAANTTWFLQFSLCVCPNSIYEILKYYQQLQTKHGTVYERNTIAYTPYHTSLRDSYFMRTTGLL